MIHDILSQRSLGSEKKNNIDRCIGVITSLFVFVLIIDPANLILKLKIPLFTLLLLFLLLKTRSLWYEGIVMVMSFYGILVATSLLGLIAGYDMVDSFTIYMYQSFLMMLLLLWAPRLNIIEKYKIPAIVLFLIVIFIYVVMSLNPELELLTYRFINENYKGTVIMSRRSFLGLNITSVYYNSVTVLIIPMAVYLYSCLRYKVSRKQNLFLFIMIFLSIIIGGTRAGMLACVGCVILIIIYRLWDSKYGKVLSVASLFLTLFLGLYLIISLLSESDEASNEVKFNLLSSFIKLIEENPSILAFGQGVGATFETTSSRGLVVQSEWSYLELIRWFGLPFATVVVFIYLYPIFLILKNRQNLKYYFPVTVSYIFYLFISGTNPLLFSSNGLLAMITAYSYALNPVYRSYTFSDIILEDNQ